MISRTIPFRSQPRGIALLPAFIAMLVAGGPPMAAQSTPASVAGVRIIASDARSITLEITPAVRFERTAGGFQLPHVTGGVLFNADERGAPADVRISIPLALPAPTGNTLEVLGATYGTPLDGRIAPVPRSRTDSAGAMHAEYRADESRYAASSAAIPVAELQYNGIARDVHAGAVVIAPYRFDPRDARVRPLASLRVRVTYASAGRAGSTGTMSSLTRSAFINSAFARGWTLTDRPTAALKRTGAQLARAWMRVEVKEDGLYELREEDFRKGGIDLATVDPDRIAIYGGNGAPLPETDLMTDNADMHQIPAIVEQSGGRATRVLFYGAGPITWHAAPNDPLPRHAINPYTKSTSYIVAVDGAPALTYARGGAGGAADVTLTTAGGRVAFEEDVFNALDLHKSGGSGRTWFGMQFDADPGRPTERTLSMKLPGLDRSQPVSYRVRVANASTGGASFAVAQGGEELGTIPLASAGDDIVAEASELTAAGRGDRIDGDNTSRLKFTFATSQSGGGYLDWYEIFYARGLHAENDRIDFWSASGSGTARYVVDGFGAGDLIGLDVTDAATPLVLEREPGDARFIFTDRLAPVATARHYVICPRSAAHAVENVTAVTPGDLRGGKLDVDVLVITHDDLKAAAEQYVSYRSSHGMHAAYVTVDQIYNEFSAGNPDPTAIRNYVAWAYRWWNVKPQYLVLLGDGTYDYRNIASHARQLVPPYETLDSLVYDRVRSSSYDDYYACVTAAPGADIDQLVDLAVGRIAVETPEEAATVIGKIMRYETTRNFGLWRAGATLVADDSNPWPEGSGDFVAHSETLAALDPAWLETRKVYLPAYPTNSGALEQKPGATLDLLQSIQRGVLITNWVGHGNANVWAHENVLRKETLIPQLANDSVPTFVSAVTCTFGAYDDPQLLTGAEMFLRHPHGGAVSLMVTTRAVVIGFNEQMMWEFYEQLLHWDAASGGFATIGAALMKAKLARAGGAGGNDRKFYILGDPALHLNLPMDSVEITAINGARPEAPGPQIKAMSQVTVEGIVRDRLGAQRTDFNGLAIVSLYDASHVVKLHPLAGSDATVDAVYDGGRLFRGPANVAGGRFTITFPIPKDISYDSASARLHVYAYSSERDAAGATPNVRVFGSASTDVTDKDGPTVKVFLDDRSFRSGDLVSRNPLLIVDLADPSGINSSGSSIGHRIEAWIDNDPHALDLTDSYQTLPTSYAEGSAQRLLTALEPGEHSARVRAWDIYNNPAETSTFFRVGDEDASLSVEDVVNYPNPMSRETDFLFRHNQTRPLDVEISIFATSGRKLRQLEEKGVTDRFVRVHWDGTDGDGHAVANGVYLYRLRVRIAGDDGDHQIETIEKVAVVR